MFEQKHQIIQCKIELVYLDCIISCFTSTNSVLIDCSNFDVESGIAKDGDSLQITYLFSLNAGVFFQHVSNRTKITQISIDK